MGLWFWFELLLVIFLFTPTTLHDPNYGMVWLRRYDALELLSCWG